MINQYGCGSTLEEASKNLKKSLIAFEKDNTEEYYIIVRVPNFFENLGLLVCTGYLNRNDAVELFGGATKNYWRLFSAVINYDRSERDEPRPDVWVYFEKLAQGSPKNKALGKPQAP